MKEKYMNIVKEVLDEIESALKDSKGLVAHQRRLAFSLSLGVVTLIEGYLDKIGVFKPGAKINHLWLKKNNENVKRLISRQIISPIGNIKNLDRLLGFAYELEKERNELAYGKPVSESILRDKINLFLDFKKVIEND